MTIAVMIENCDKALTNLNMEADMNVTQELRYLGRYVAITFGGAVAILGGLLLVLGLTGQI